MRSGQQNKRGRGRNNGNNNGRKGANPLTRTYDSSGPDVKVRGTAQHIAEKYAQLARDAQGSGDRVMAENYLQHAEHYNRIIAAAQAQMQERYQRDDRSDQSDSDDSDGSDDANTTAKETSADKVSDGSGPQPVIDGVPAEVALENEEQSQEASERPRRQQRQRRPRRQQNSNAEGGEKSEGDAGSSDSSGGEPALAEAGE